MGQYAVDQNTVALLHFEEGFRDENGRIWTANGGLTTSTIDRKYGSNSVYFDGTTDKNLSTPNTSDLLFGAEPFTIDFWIKPESGMGDWAALLGSSVGYKKQGGWMINLNNTNGSIGFWRGVDNYEDVIGTSAGVISSGSWTHVAVVKEVANSSNIKIYINGAKKADGNLQGSVILNTTAPLRLGRGYDTWVNPWIYKGYIDEVRISNIARWTSDFDPGKEPTNAPINLTATAGDKKVTLSWNAVIGATGYNVKRSTTAGGPYTTIASNVVGTSYEDTNVVNGTTYYYVVTAIGVNGESINSNEASATPNASVGQRILRVTMIDSSEREYQLPTSDIDGFVAWYVRNVGTGTTGYMLQKQVGSVRSKEYLAFDKIISFDIIDLQG